MEPMQEIRLAIILKLIRENPDSADIRGNCEIADRYVNYVRFGNLH